jgi:hypothetical protein
LQKVAPRRSCRLVDRAEILSEDMEQRNKTQRTRKRYTPQIKEQENRLIRLPAVAVLLTPLQPCLLCSISARSVSESVLQRSPLAPGQIEANQLLYPKTLTTTISYDHRTALTKDQFRIDGKIMVDFYSHGGVILDMRSRSSLGAGIPLLA